MCSTVPQISLRDTTLREGAQIPGSCVATADRQRFVALLDELGVPEIEIGLPDGVDACGGLARFIHERGLRIKPTGLVPCYGTRWRQQVDLAADCGLRIDVLVPVSDHLLRQADHYQLTPEQVAPRLTEVIAYAHHHGVPAGAALEEVVMALERLCARPTGVNTRRLRELSAFVEQMTGIRNSRLKPIVGRYCFAHVPVMHIRCIAGGNPEAFEPFDPQRVGADRTYGFCLPVDYTAALEPFLRKCAVHLSPPQTAALLEKLRHEPDQTEEQILGCIHDIASH